MVKNEAKADDFSATEIGELSVHISQIEAELFNHTLHMIGLLWWGRRSETQFTGPVVNVSLTCQIERVWTNN